MLRIYVKSPPAPVEIVPDYYPVKYGLLYNWYAATDARKICAEGWEVSTGGQTVSDWGILIAHLGGSSVAGGKLKEIGVLYFDSPNTSAVNSVNFNGRGSGGRYTNWTDFLIKRWGGFWTSQQYSKSTGYAYYLKYNNESILLYSYGIVKFLGMNIRLVRPATESEQLLADGTACAPYIGNDLKSYRTVKIGTQVWTAQNSCETKFRNLEYIPGYNAEGYVPIDNTTWAAATTAMCCVYDDDLTNM